MAVGEEASWVVLDLLNLESSTGILAISHEAGGEWAFHTSTAAADAVIAFGIGKRDPGRAVCALDSLVNVSSSLSKRLEFAAEVNGDDVPADEIVRTVDHVLEKPDSVSGARGRTGVWRGAVDDLIA